MLEVLMPPSTATVTPTRANPLPVIASRPHLLFVKWSAGVLPDQDLQGGV